MLGEGPANSAGSNSLARLKNGLGQLPHDRGIGLNQMKGESLRRARAYSRQAIESDEKLRDGFGKGGHRNVGGRRAGDSAPCLHQPGDLHARGYLAHFRIGNVAGLA